MTAKPKYPHVRLSCRRIDSHALGVVAAVSRVLEKAGVARDEFKAFCREALLKDYDHVLQTAVAWVHSVP